MSKTLTQFPLYMCTLPPLASVSRAGGMAFLESPESMETLRSRFDLVFSIPTPTPLTDWLTAFSPGLLEDIWLILTPWLPALTLFGPRWPAAPCCCWACWFTLAIWDRLSPVTCLPWLASLLSGCIWLAGDWGGGLVWRIVVPASGAHIAYRQHWWRRKRKDNQLFKLKLCIRPWNLCFCDLRQIPKILIKLSKRSYDLAQKVTWEM